MAIERAVEGCGRIGLEGNHPQQMKGPPKAAQVDGLCDRREAPVVR